jgi:hypothetical protein
MTLKGLFVGASRAVATWTWTNLSLLLISGLTIALSDTNTIAVLNIKRTIKGMRTDMQILTNKVQVTSDYVDSRKKAWQDRDALVDSRLDALEQHAQGL